MRLLFVGFILLFQVHWLAAQSGSDSGYVAFASEKNREIYLDNLKSAAPLYNGKMYYPSQKSVGRGHVFFSDNQYTLGSITSSGHTYKNVNMMYDLVVDQLVILNYDKIAALVVEPEYVNSFSLHSHTFLHIKPDSVTALQVKPGYYDLLEAGQATLLAKRKKVLTETVGLERVEWAVSQDDRYFLLQDSVFTRVKGKKDLLSALKSTHRQNRQFIKTERLRFKRDKEQAMIKLVAFHNTLR